MNVQETTIPEQRVLDGKAFPRVLTPAQPEADLADTLSWLHQHQQELRVQLLEAGAIVATQVADLNDS